MFQLGRAMEKIKDIDTDKYEVESVDHAYVAKLSQIESTDAKQLLKVGVDTKEADRIGTFIQ